MITKQQFDFNQITVWIQYSSLLKLTRGLVNVQKHDFI